MDYKSKYLKYKNKYLELKGGVSRQNHTITHFNHIDYDIAMAEAIYPGKLSEQMTSHGLGTGIYGFIDVERRENSVYANNNYTSTTYNIINPVILKDIDIDNENRTDLDEFTNFSTTLNMICYKIHNNQLTVDDIPQILHDRFILNDGSGNYFCTKDISTTLQEIIQTVNLFLIDYNIIMHTVEERFVLMPINYFLQNKGYDGIYNKNRDDAGSGSVKYFFNDNYNARGYTPDEKIIVNPIARLVFLTNRF
jgi:hypothetical protein